MKNKEIYNIIDFIGGLVMDTETKYALIVKKFYLGKGPNFEDLYMFRPVEMLDGMMDEDGTAIGMGLANAVNRLKDSQAKSKVIILLTDGTNNRGEIDPMTASELAKAYGIRVYTIGVGTKGEAPYPVQTIFGIQKQMVPVEIDEETLEAIAEKTGGHYFRATNNNSLKAIYNDIDKMEKTKIKVTEHTSKNEEYLPYAIAAILLLLLEILLRNTILRHIP